MNSFNLAVCGGMANWRCDMIDIFLSVQCPDRLRRENSVVIRHNFRAIWIDLRQYLFHDQ